MQLFAEQLKMLTEICEALNHLAPLEPDSLLYLNKVPVFIEPGEIFGYFVDEIGGCYCFVTKDFFEATYEKSEED